MPQNTVKTGGQTAKTRINRSSMINSENEPHERDTSFVASLKDAIVNVWENASEDVHKLADSFLQ